MDSDFDCLVDEYPDRESWLQARRLLIGASDTAGIFGVGYSDQSPITIFDSKINPPRETTDPAKLKRFKIGRLMEPALRAVFSEETGLPCASPGDFAIHRHRDLPWLGASLDAFTRHDEYGYCPVELKNVSNFAREEWDDDEPPLKFNVQLQHQLAVTGASHGFLLGLIGGNEPVVKTIERSQRFIDNMLARLEEFWGYVERRELPPVDTSIATAKLLGKLFPEDTGGTVFLDAEAKDWIDDIEGSKETIKTAEAVKTAAENQLKAAMKDNSFAELPDGRRYSWKTQSRKGYYVEPTSFRVLRRAK